MYINQLLDAYKHAKNYAQDKQIAHDFGVHPSQITQMRKGKRYVSDNEIVFLAEVAGVDPKEALLGCHADRNENPHIKALWEDMLGKVKRHSNHVVSGVGAVALLALGTPKSQYVLCILC